MIHSQYFEVIEQFLGDYNKEIYGRQLIGKIPQSQKAIALNLEKLEKEGILQSRKSGNMKFYSLNKKNPQIKDILIITELTRNIQFCNKHKIISQIFREDDRIIGIFGSYAKEIQKSTSDLDVFIIGDKKDDYTDQGKSFDLDISIKYFTIKEVKNMLKNKLLS